MHLNQLFFNAQFVVIPSVSKCAYNQWNLNTFAYCGFRVDKMRLAAITKIIGIFQSDDLHVMFCLVSLHFE